MKPILKYSILLSFLFIIVLVSMSFMKRNGQDEVAKYHVKTSHHEGVFGYEIYRNDQLYIRQNYIPAVKGKQVFRTATEAMRIAELVLKKLENSPFPTITIAELKENNVTFNP